MPTVPSSRPRTGLSSPDSVSLIAISRTAAMLWRMNDDRVAEIRRRLAEGVDAFNRADLDAAIAGYAEGCRYQVARDHPETRLCVGRDEIRRYQAQWFDQFDEIHFEVAEV